MSELTTYPNTFYRVSVKAFVTNDNGGVLVLKENQDTWSLPGGGLDHGEDPIVGLRRELKEELGIQAIDSITPLCIKTFYLESKQTWLMWVVFIAKTEVHNFELGEGVTAAQYINPAQLKDSTDIFEKLVYEVAHETL
jgi:ADP-ribose pyrophosphatase YjhB (NUDIX family)